MASKSQSRARVARSGGARRLRGIRQLAPCLLAILLPVAGPASAQVNDPAYRDYFLVGEFGEICTMCEVAVLCEAGDSPPAHENVPDAGDFTLYHIQTRTFWSQVSTIWEWFLSNFSPGSVDGHTRPVHVHRVDDGQFAPMMVVEARVTLEEPYIDMGDQRIERVERQWQSAQGLRVGYCQQLPLWDTLDEIAARSPGDGEA